MVKNDFTHFEKQSLRAIQKTNKVQSDFSAENFELKTYVHLIKKTLGSSSLFHNSQSVDEISFIIERKRPQISH